MMDAGDDLRERVLIYLDLESLNPATRHHEKQGKHQELSNTRKCFSYVKRKVDLITDI